MSGINAGRVDASRRLARIVEILKEAEYPLSSEEIAKRAYDLDNSGRIMLNISTNIGEIRAGVNRDAGYNVSFSTAWKISANPEQVMRVNDDKSVTFFVRSPAYPWHDGRPRYYLLAAPGWIPRWRVDRTGLLVRGENREQRTEDRGHRTDPPNIGAPVCVFSGCGIPLTEDHRGAPFCAEHRAQLFAATKAQEAI